MQTFDLVFIGNGIISIVSALKAKELIPNLKIAIIGPLDRPFSASVAAGAMHAAFCEIEDTFHKVPRDQEIFSICLKSRKPWQELLSRPELQNSITASDTIMYRRKNSTLFEMNNFEAACLVAKEHGCLEDVPLDTLKKIFQGSLAPEEVVAKKFLGEFAIDPKYFFEQSNKLLEKLGVTFIDDCVKKINASDPIAEINLGNGGIIQSKRLVIAAGSYTSKVIPENLTIIPIYHAVGTAFSLDKAPTGYEELKMVIRTPNRGGAQCGMHIVPRNEAKYYLGAGNYLSNEVPAHRIETIRYLIEICEKELYGKQIIYNTKSELLLGSRAKTLDGYPLIGSCEESPQIFIATGCYRIGLTIAPMIAEEIGRWLNDEKPSGIFNNCNPTRKPHSYPSMEIASQYFSESRISNLIEHGLLYADDERAINDKKIELENIAKNYNASILNAYDFDANFVVDPDMYSMLTALPEK